MDIDIGNNKWIVIGGVILLIILFLRGRSSSVSVPNYTSQAMALQAQIQQSQIAADVSTQQSGLGYLLGVQKLNTAANAAFQGANFGTLNEMIQSNTKAIQAQNAVRLAGIQAGALDYMSLNNAIATTNVSTNQANAQMQKSSNDLFGQIFTGMTGMVTALAGV